MRLLINLCEEREELLLLVIKINEVRGNRFHLGLLVELVSNKLIQLSQLFAHGGVPVVFHGVIRSIDKGQSKIPALEVFCNLRPFITNLLLKRINNLLLIGCPLLFAHIWI